MTFIRVELVGGPMDGEALWYEQPMEPKLVEFMRGDNAIEVGVVTGAPRQRSVSEVRVARYYRTSRTTMDYWPPRKARPRRRAE